jgi:hypothetical protein
VPACTLTRRAVPCFGIAALAVITAATAGALACGLCGCTSVDPGPNFVVPNATFDPDYFYCHVEPQLIFAYNCGPGLASDNGSCHFNPSAVSGMALVNHPPVNCGGGDHPVDLSQTGSGSAAAGNYEAVSLEMSSDYTSAPVYVRPSGNNHPRQVFKPDDPVVNQILSTWASK